MPRRAPTYCRHPGCRVRVHNGYCDTHRPAQVDRTARERQRRRALPTNSAAWRRIRAAHLMAQPLCVMCEREGRITPATHVDHIDGDSHNNHPDNLQSLCASCHSRKTARQDGGFGNRGRGV